MKTGMIGKSIVAQVARTLIETGKAKKVRELVKETSETRPDLASQIIEELEVPNQRRRIDEK